MNNTINLAGIPYPLARESLLPKGAKKWNVTARPSVPSDATGPTNVIEWQVWGPNLISFELVSPGQTSGWLGPDYGVDVDTRFDGVATLGPAVTSVDLSGTSGSGQNTNCWALSGTMNATQFLYVGRGNHMAKLNPATMARVTEASGNFAANVTGCLYTKASNGTQQISCFFRTSAYEVISTVANAGSNDTHAANGGGEILTTAIATPDRVLGAKDSVAGGASALVRQNILTGAVTMDSGANWITAGTIYSDSTLINHIEMDANFACIGTDGGMFMVDPNYNTFRPIDPETERDSNNCAGMGYWMPLGVIFSLKYGTRFIHWGEGQSMGPETFLQHTGPIRGRVTAVAGTDRWLYVMLYDDLTGDTYWLAGRPKLTGDPHSSPISWYTLRKFASKQSLFLGYLGTNNNNTPSNLPTMIMGYGMDIAYSQFGRTNRWPDDTSYTYATSGTLYLTEARRDPSLIKDIEAVEFEAGGTMSANQTITIGASFDGAAAVQLTGTLGYNGAVTSSGYKRLLVVDDSSVPLSRTTWSGRRIKPQIVFATNDATKAPQVVGKLRFLYRTRPIMLKQVSFVVELRRDTQNQYSARELENQLINEWGSSSSLINDPDGNSYYLNVEDVKIQTVASTAGDSDTGAGDIKLASVSGTLWPTASGS